MNQEALNFQIFKHLLKITKDYFEMKIRVLNKLHLTIGMRCTFFVQMKGLLHIYSFQKGG